MKQSTDTFRCISLDILKTYSLKAELASYTNSKDFEKYACKQCNKHVRANVISLGICCKSPFCSDATCEAV